MAGPGAPAGLAARWKRHIVRQLRQRDRTQKALFLELVPAYNRLLEKAELLARFSEKIQPEPNDVTPASHQGLWAQGMQQGTRPGPTELPVHWRRLTAMNTPPVPVRQVTCPIVWGWGYEPSENLSLRVPVGVAT
uniref:Autophagy related 16 like 2 n=1 Tax=Equus asinus TaxID=9793 RepID=A0A9L0JX84_EQUAS